MKLLELIKYKILRIYYYNELFFEVFESNEYEQLFDLLGGQPFIVDPFKILNFKLAYHGIDLLIHERFNNRDMYNVRLILPLDVLEFVKLKYDL